MAALRGASSDAPGLVFSTGLLTRVKAATFIRLAANAGGLNSERTS